MPTLIPFGEDTGKKQNERTKRAKGKKSWMPHRENHKSVGFHTFEVAIGAAIAHLLCGQPLGKQVSH